MFPLYDWKRLGASRRICCDHIVYSRELVIWWESGRTENVDRFLPIDPRPSFIFCVILYVFMSMQTCSNYECCSLLVLVLYCSLVG